MKLENTRALGAEVVLYDRFTEDREAIARRIVAERGATLVPAYDDPHVVAGQGTVGLELMQQAAELGMTPDQVLVPTSGGGLTGGTAIAVRALSPAAAVYGVEPEAFDDTRRSLAAGTLLKNPPEARSICDALQSSPPGTLTFAINRELLAGILTVSDAEVASRHGARLPRPQARRRAGRRRCACGRAVRKDPARGTHDGDRAVRRQRGPRRRSSAALGRLSASSRNSTLPVSSEYQAPGHDEAVVRDQVLDDGRSVPQLVHRRAHVRRHHRVLDCERPLGLVARDDFLDARPDAVHDVALVAATGSARAGASSSIVAAIAPQEEWPEHDDQARAEAVGRELDAADQRGRDDVAGNADHEQVAGPLVEHELDRHARIRAAEHDRERFLGRGQLARAARP